MRGVCTRLILTLLALVAVGAALVFGFRAVFPGFGRWDPAQERIPAGVVFEAEGRKMDLGGLRSYEATGALEEIAGQFTLLPRNAYYDRSTKGVVPALDGRRLDVAATVAKALAAALGQVVGPVYYPVSPAVDLNDFPNSPVYQGNPARQAVAVILNIAWGDEHLDAITTLFENAGGRLTICPVGTWLEGNEERAAWLAAAASRGHEIGNHGYYNRPMTYPSAPQVKNEIEATSDLIEAACGRRPPIFAPPMGAISDLMLAAAAEAGYRTVMWSLDTIDWRLEGVEIIAGRVTSRVGPGDIILCHPTPQTGPAMEFFLPVLAEKGLRVITVSELLSPTLLEDAPGGAG